MESENSNEDFFVSKDQSDSKNSVDKDQDMEEDSIEFDFSNGTKFLFNSDTNDGFLRKDLYIP